MSWKMDPFQFLTAISKCFQKSVTNCRKNPIYANSRRNALNKLRKQRKKKITVSEVSDWKGWRRKIRSNDKVKILKNLYKWLSDHKSLVVVVVVAQSTRTKKNWGIKLSLTFSETVGKEFSSVFTSLDFHFFIDIENESQFEKINTWKIWFFHEIRKLWITCFVFSFNHFSMKKKDIWWDYEKLTSEICVFSFKRREHFFRIPNRQSIQSFVQSEH